MTLSCGTGVTAAALAYAREFEEMSSPIEVETNGGTLKVSFGFAGSGFTDVRLTGPAKVVFEGKI